MAKVFCGGIAVEYGVIEDVSTSLLDKTDHFKISIVEDKDITPFAIPVTIVLSKEECTLLQSIMPK